MVAVVKLSIIEGLTAMNAMPKNNKCMQNPLEGKKKRKSTGSTREAMVDDNEGEEEQEGDTTSMLPQKR
jgi:hypothetical protein